MDFEPLLPDSFDSNSPSSFPTHHCQNTNRPSLSPLALAFTPLENHHPFTLFLSLIHLLNTERPIHIIQLALHPEIPICWTVHMIPTRTTPHGPHLQDWSTLLWMLNPITFLHNLTPSLAPYPPPSRSLRSRRLSWRATSKPNANCRATSNVVSNNNLPTPIYKILAIEEMMFSVESETKAGYYAFLRSVRNSGHNRNLLSKAHGFMSTVQILLGPFDHDTTISVSFPNGVGLSVHLPKSTFESNPPLPKPQSWR